MQSQQAELILLINKQCSPYEALRNTGKQGGDNTP